MKEMKRTRHHISILLVLFLFISGISLDTFAVEISDTTTQSIQTDIPKSKDTMVNSPPNPPEITGPISGNINVYYSYNFTITDPEEDIMFNLEINWGDGTQSIDCGCDKSWQNGTVVSASHRWKKQNSYGITARVSDSSGQFSNWSEPLIVSMPKQKSVYPFERILNLLQNLYVPTQFISLLKNTE